MSGGWLVALVFVGPPFVVEVSKYDLAAVEGLKSMVSFAWLVSGLNERFREFIFGW